MVKSHIRNLRVGAVAMVRSIPFLMAVGCGDSKGGAIVYEGYNLPAADEWISHASFMRVDTLRGHPVLDSTHVINPAAIQVSGGDRLYLTEGFVSSAPFVRVFRIGSWDEEWAFGRKGSGPAEFGSLSVRLVPALNGDLWVWEFGRRQLTRLARYPDHGELVPDRCQWTPTFTTIADALFSTPETRTMPVQSDSERSGQAKRGANNR